jgi:hypothetical protein
MRSSVIFTIQINENQVNRACSKRGEDGNAYKVLVGKSKGKDPKEVLRVDEKIIQI